MQGTLDTRSRLLLHPIWDHQCCGERRWDAARLCDRCGAPGTTNWFRISMQEAMELQHAGCAGWYGPLSMPWKARPVVRRAKPTSALPASGNEAAVGDDKESCTEGDVALPCSALERTLPGFCLAGAVVFIVTVICLEVGGTGPGPADIEQDVRIASRFDEGQDVIDPLPTSLWTTYQRTELSASVDGVEIRLRPGATHPSLDDALQRRKVTTWAYITAWNPGSRQLARQENDARHEQLKNDLAARGFEAFEGEGFPMKLAWPPERCLLVFGISVQEAIAIGRRYGQNAIVVGEAGRKAEFRGC